MRRRSFPASAPSSAWEHWDPPPEPHLPPDLVRELDELERQTGAPKRAHAPKQADALESESELVSPWLRMRAAGIDAAVVGSLVVLHDMTSERWAEVTFASVLLVTLVVVSVFVLLPGRGQTLGKLLSGIKIVHQGRRPGFYRGVILRTVVGGVILAVPVLGLLSLLSVFGPARRCTHDLISDTFVVRA